MLIKFTLWPPFYLFPTVEMRPYSSTRSDFEQKYIQTKIEVKFFEQKLTERSPIYELRAE